MMERGVHRGRWNKKATVGTILILMCMVVPTLTLVEPSEEQTCPHGDYLSKEGVCCNKCSPGFKLVEECHAAGQRSNCTPCPPGQFTDQMNFADNCRSCRRCKTKHDTQVSACERYQNTICRCDNGYYKNHIDSETYECRRCRRCGPDEKEKTACTPEKNTQCECTENYYRVNNTCKPCTNCSAECKHRCSTPSPSTKKTKASEGMQGYFINVIGGAAAVALVMLVLVVLLTYMVTKWSIKKKLLNTSSQSSDISQDSCKVLITSEEPSNNNSVKACLQSPVSEQEQLSNLPDCIPLEIKSPPPFSVPDLIYVVLDLVPVLQVKQLVRSLGVTDTEIEQAELDYRSCREAHYQMLRVWAERGSRTGGMLPLLQELLNELRKMHLGRAAEELQTKYGIQ